MIVDDVNNTVHTSQGTPSHPGPPSETSDSSRREPTLTEMSYSPRLDAMSVVMSASPGRSEHSRVPSTGSQGALSEISTSSRVDSTIAGVLH